MTSQAAVFNAAADLLANEVPNGSASNPNGTWTYGGYDDVNSATRVFTVIPVIAAPPDPQHEDSWVLLSGEFQGWGNNTGDVVPAITVNTTGGALSPCCGITPIGSHKIFIHPGPSGRSIFDDITVRWTAPGAGTIDVTANWIQRHFAAQEANVLINGVVVFTALATTGAGTTYSATSLPVAAGDTIDFVLDQGPAGYAGGSTEFDAEIDFAQAQTGVGPAQVTLRQERPGVPDDQFVEVAVFTLAANQSIDPITEAVTIELSEPVCGAAPFSSLSLPPGSFTARSGGKIAFFDGVVTDTVTGALVTASVRITREREGYKVSLDFKNADYTCLEGTDSRKVQTTLTVGNDRLSGRQCFRRTGDGDLYFPPGTAVCP